MAARAFFSEVVAGQAREQPGRIARWEGGERHSCRTLQGDTAPAGDQHQTASAPRQQRFHLSPVSGVVQQEQHALASQPVAPQAGPGVQVIGYVPHVDANAGQQIDQNVGRIVRTLASASVKGDEQLAIRELAG